MGEDARRKKAEEEARRRAEKKVEEEVKQSSDIEDSDEDRPKLKSTKKAETVETKKASGPADLVRGKPKKKKAWEEEENSDDDEDDAEVTQEDVAKWIENEKNREKEEAEAARKKIEDEKR